MKSEERMDDMEHIDGYVTAIISEDGERGKIKDVVWFDYRLQDCMDDSCVEEDILETLLASLPKEMYNSYVFATFQYSSVQSGYWEYVEYEDVFSMVEMKSLKPNYKDIWKEQLVTQLTHEGHIFGTLTEILEKEEEEGYDHYALEEVEEWETVYDEELVIPKQYESEEAFEQHRLGQSVEQIENLFSVEKENK